MFLKFTEVSVDSLFIESTAVPNSVHIELKNIEPKWVYGMVYPGI